MNNGAEPHTKSSAGSVPLDRSTLIRELIGLSIDCGHETSKDEGDESNNFPRQSAPCLLFNADCDCRYAQPDPRFAGVAHVFHQNWLGIRSAVGALPGDKIAAPPERELTAKDRTTLLAQLAAWGVDKAIFHGFSPATASILKALCAEGICCYLVWHGSLAQLALRPEVDFFEAALRAANRGLFKRAHMLKAGMECVFPNAFRPMLFNSVPYVTTKRLCPPFAEGAAVALVPAHTDIWKNLHTSLVGAALSSIETVFHYGKVRGNISVLKRCRRVRYDGHERHLSLLSQVDVAVNVTVIDCHPMVPLESLAAGAPCVTGPLFLDALQDHPYTIATTVSNPFDVKGMAWRLNSLRMMNSSELIQIIDDYRAATRKLSLERYMEFLGS
jgi:hypothetical protein